MQTTGGCAETEITIGETAAGNETVDERLLVDGRDVEAEVERQLAEVDSQMGLEGGGRVGHEPMV